VRAALNATGASAQLFVYGFAAFIDDATAAIEAAGADAGEAKIENFG
jgi:ferredoxin-NADP reductase